MKADAFYTELGEATTKQDIQQMFAKLKVVKDALDAADMFREQSVKYAKYEAYALVRAVEISGDTSLIKGKWRKLTAEWLASLPEDERETYIEKCSDGKTIDNIYRELIYTPQQRSALGAAVVECKDEARRKLKENGVVSVPDIVSKHAHKFPRAMAREITDGVRNAIRNAGGVGIGDNAGTYIDPDKKSAYVSDAIAVRIDAVARDIESIADLAQRAESKPVFHIKGNGSQISFTDVTYMILAGVGCAKVHFDSARARREALALLRQVVGEIE